MINLHGKSSRLILEVDYHDQSLWYIIAVDQHGTSSGLIFRVLLYIESVILYLVFTLPNLCCLFS